MLAAPATVDPSPRKQLASKLTDLDVSEKTVAAKTAVAALEEPILTPSPKRFVLFPIQYHEVCLLPGSQLLVFRGRCSLNPAFSPLLPCSHVGLANVQEG